MKRRPDIFTILIVVVTIGYYLWLWYMARPQKVTVHPLKVTIIDSGGAKLKVESKVIESEIR